MLMKMLKRWGPVWAALWLCGCFQVQDELTLQPDGSGSVRLTLRTSLPDEMTAMFNMPYRFGAGREPIYPPANQAEAQRFFPPKDFTLQVTENKTNDGKTVVIAASFKDVNALLASPYGRAHQLALDLQNGALRLRALSACETLARGAQFQADGETTAFPMPGLEDAQKKKGEMRFEFRVTLPNPATDANGVRDNKTIIWTAERAKCKDDDEFAGKLSGLLEAKCAAEGLKFSPLTPPRLGLASYSQLAAGQTTGAAPLPDTNKIAAAVRFVPFVLQVTRSLDLSGEGSGRESQAQLIGAVILPVELAPQRWGEVRLLEAVDAKGNNLAPKPDEEGTGRMSRFERFGDRFGASEEADDEDEGKVPVEPGQTRKVIALNLKAPEWKVKEIVRIKGALELQYLGNPEIIKLSNAVPASLVIDMSKRSAGGFRFDSERGQLTDPRLTELGLSVRVQMATVQNGMTSLSLETGGGKAALIDAQLFDADARPWPTTLMQSDSAGGDQRSCQLLVAGKPKPPFSLAFLVGGVGASVTVPILVEKIPVEGK